ncbi:MAG: TerB family tellurite resistance protein [Alphaproteobacteria bacterium]|nr:TerB family tellurite resistance protein [Alphaproteobacteria bacterium]
MQKGRIIGSILGFCLNGPAGCVLGYFLGRSYDLQRKHADVWVTPQGGINSFAAYTEQSAFAIGVIVLSAKMARADGKVSRAEIQAFRRVFDIRHSRENVVGEIFNEARLSPDGFEPYAQRLAQIFGDRPSVLEGILGSLFVIAAADSPLSEKEIVFLKAVSSIFGFNKAAFVRIAACSGVDLPGTRVDPPPAPKVPDPNYIVLGISETATTAEIKSAYRSLIREHHPDRLVASGVPAEYIAAATEKMKRINAAYDAVCKQRGIS